MQNLFNSDTTVSQELNILKRGKLDREAGQPAHAPGRRRVPLRAARVRPVDLEWFVPAAAEGPRGVRRQDRVRGHPRRSAQQPVRRQLRAAAGDQGAAGGSDSGSSDSGSGSSGDSGSSDSGSTGAPTPARPVGRRAARPDRAASTTRPCRRPSTTPSRRCRTARTPTRTTTSSLPPRPTSACRKRSRRRPKPRTGTRHTVAGHSIVSPPRPRVGFWMCRGVEQFGSSLGS